MQQGNGWPFQLLSVACLSLASKLEEPRAPLLLELQIFQTKFVFEPKTVQRMEIRVLTNLNWRLRSVTPFDFIDYFASKLPCSSGSMDDLLARVISISSDLILNTTRGNFYSFFFLIQILPFFISFEKNEMKYFLGFRFLNTFVSRRFPGVSAVRHCSGCRDFRRGQES